MGVRGTDQHSDAAAPDLQQPPQSCLLIRGERGASSRPRDGGWPGPVSLAPGHCKWALAGITTVLSSPDFPSGGKLPPPLQPPRLGALLPLPSCLLPVRSHPTEASFETLPSEPASREDSGVGTHDMIRLDIEPCIQAEAPEWPGQTPPTFTSPLPVPSRPPPRHTLDGQAEACRLSPRISMAPVCSLHGQMHCTGTSPVQSPSTTPNRPAIHGLSVLSQAPSARRDCFTTCIPLTSHGLFAAFRRAERRGPGPMDHCRPLPPESLALSQVVMASANSKYTVLVGTRVARPGQTHP